MSDYELIDSGTVHLKESDVELSKGDIIEDDGRVSYEVIRFERENVIFKFIGEHHDEITIGEEGMDLISVWDSKFAKGIYEKK